MLIVVKRHACAFVGFCIVENANGLFDFFVRFGLVRVEAFDRLLDIGEFMARPAFDRALPFTVTGNALAMIRRDQTRFSEFVGRTRFVTTAAAQDRTLGIVMMTAFASAAHVGHLGVEPVRKNDGAVPIFKTIQDDRYGPRRGTVANRDQVFARTIQQTRALHGRIIAGVACLAIQVRFQMGSCIR
jgi:hypothetical protein